MSKIIHNPVIRGEGASPRDPWVILHEGMYYHCFSRGGSVWVNRVESLNDLDNGGEVSVYTPPEGTAYSKELWAPELHFLDGRFYIYVACDDGENANHRMYVLEGTDDPLVPFAFVGKITDPTDRWAIDGTVIEWEGNRYFVWSGWEGTENVAQNLYIARMDSPTSICSERVLLSAPKYAWEKAGGDGKNLPYVNEGPEGLTHGGRLHIVYSAAGSWCNDYCLGMLSLREGGDPMCPDDWEKAAVPVFSRNENAKGPGHCSFTTVTDAAGKVEDYILYHAFDEDASFGWDSVSARAQRFSWQGDSPVFGNPAPLDAAD